MDTSPKPLLGICLDNVQGTHTLPSYGDSGGYTKGLHATRKDVRISAPHKVHTGADCPLPASSSTMASRAEGDGGGFAVVTATTCTTLDSPNGDTSCIEEPDFAFMAEFFGLDEE